MRWRFNLINSKDMSRIGQLRQAKGRRLSVLINKHGSANFSYPMNGTYAADIVPYQTGITAERFNWRATLELNDSGTRGNVWDRIWSGYVQPIREDLTTGRMEVSCIGWTGRFDRRLLRKDFDWRNIDDGQIIKDIIQHVNGLADGVQVHAGGVSSYTYPSSIHGDGTTIRWPAGSTPNTPSHCQFGSVGTPNEGVGGATAYTTAVRNFKAEKYSMAWPHVERLIELENGCDIHVDPTTRLITVHRRYRRVKSNVVIAFATGPKNASAFDRQIDADQQINYMLARGEANVIPQYAESVTSQQAIGPLEEVTQLSGVTDPGVLLAYAGAEVLVRSNGLITYGVTPFNYTPEGGVPEPFVDYREGDQVYASAKSLPRVNIDKQAVRVFGMSVSIDDDTGNEKLDQLQISP